MESYKYYGDIINMPRHISHNHIPMNIKNRAAQFAPFSALPGHSDALMETSRLTETYNILYEEEQERINNILQDILHNLGEINIISVKYFVKDSKKPGGYYKTKKGHVKKIDTYNRIMVIDGIKIHIDDIVDISTQNSMVK